MKKAFSTGFFLLLMSVLVASLAWAQGDQKAPRQIDRSVYPEVTYGPPLDGPLSTLNESFEGATFPPAGWTKLSPDGGSGWNRQLNNTSPIPGWQGGRITVPPGGGTAVAFATWNTGGPSSNNQWLVTPQLTNVLASDSLKFWLRYWPNSFSDTVEVRISTTTPTVGAFTILVATLGYRAPSADTNWNQFRYRLADYVPPGSNIYIAFRERVTDNLNDGASFSLDLVQVTSPPAPSCNTFASSWCAPGTYPDVPTKTFHQSAAWLGDTLFMHTPDSTGLPTTTVYKYRPGIGWSAAAPLPSPRVGGPMIACKGKLYYIGGGQTGITAGTNTLYEYDPATGAWTEKAPMPVALSGQGAVCWRDSMIFVVGGPWTGSATNRDVHFYDIISDGWGTITNSLPASSGRRTFALGVSGDKIVMAAGFNTAFLKSVFVGTVVRFDSIAWVAAPDVPTGYTGLSRPGGVAYGDRFFVVGGERGGPGGYYDTTHVYRLSTNSWSNLINQKPVKMSNIYNGVTAKCINDTIRIFLPGGFGSLTGATPGAAFANFDVIGCGPGLTGVPEQISEVPDGFRLEQNYPNPFNPSTTIRFSVPTRDVVTLHVYNLLGQQVAILTEGVLEAGTYSVQWNAAGLASGMYWYRLRSGEFTDTRKLLLLK